MKSGFQERYRPRGVLLLVVVSVIGGSILLAGSVMAFMNPGDEGVKKVLGVKLESLLSIFTAILAIFGIIYIVLGIGFFRADAWALKLYNRVNRAISIFAIFYGNLIYSTIQSDPASVIIGQLSAIVYTFAVNTYLQRDGVKLYFGSTHSSGTAVQRSPL